MWSVLFKRRKSVAVCVLILACFRNKLCTIWEQDVENIYKWVSWTKKKRRRKTMSTGCIQVRIYRTININRPRDNWRKENKYGHKTLYIRVKYTMQHGEETKNPAWRFYIWQVSQWNLDTRNARDRRCPQQAVLRSVLTLSFHSTLTLAL